MTTDLDLLRPWWRRQPFAAFLVGFLTGAVASFLVVGWLLP